MGVSSAIYWLARHLHTILITYRSQHQARCRVIVVIYDQLPSEHASFYVSVRITISATEALSLYCRWPARVEQSPNSTTTGHELFAVQAATENISVRELVNHGAL